THPVPITGDTQADDEGVAPPSFSSIAAPDAPLAPQPFPLFSTIGVLPASPVMIAYNLSNLFHPGPNRIIVRVHALDRPPAILADGLIDFGGRKQRFGSQTNWWTLSDPARADVPTLQPAITVNNNGAAPAGLIPQVAAFPHLLPDDDLRRVTRWTVAVTATFGLVFLLWGFAAPLFASDAARVEELWGADAVAHLPMVILMAALWLSTFDVRLPSLWCFDRKVIAALLVLLILSKLLLGAKPSAARFVDRVSWFAALARRNWQPPALVALMAAGMVVRAWGLAKPAMSHDEVSVVRMANGVLKLGFPYMMTGSYVRYAATYELLPYPITLFKLLFGDSVFVLRMPALIFGTLTIGVIGWAGRRMMDWRVGITAAIVYAFLPAAILHSRDLFYPAQESFFALLTVWLFYEAINGAGINRRFMNFATVAFIFTYFSWEGSGFFLPALVVALLVCKWGERDWIANPHLWRSFAIITALVIVELCWKLNVVIPDYLGVGKDLNDLASPSLVFLQRLIFDPWFYLRAFFFVDNQWLLTILAILGFVFLRRQKAILYLTTLLISLGVCYTCLLGLYHPKYAYNWTTILVLAAVGAFFQLYDQVRQIDLNSNAARAARRFALVSGVAGLIVFSNPYAVKLYRLAAVPEVPPFDSRLGISFSPDYRSEDLYIARHLE
ncbi:MAG: glycosyltransferase family 39 protein, partial [Candidatus Binataceae bacterium]